VNIDPNYYSLSVFTPDSSLTNSDFLRTVAIETAKMSYPGSMSRGRKPVVIKNAKDKIERYFVDNFDLKTIWRKLGEVADNYDKSHKQWAERLGSFLERDCLGNPDNTPATVAAKFIDTFMHQLMKYERFRPLWPHLHLPLDSRVLNMFSRIDESEAMELVRPKIGDHKTAYTIPYETYAEIQTTLWAFIAELNRRPNVEVRFCSRIELNWLWL